MMGLRCIISYPGPDRSVRLEQLRAGRAQPRRYRNRRIGEFLKEPEKPNSRLQKYRRAQNRTGGQ